MSSDYSPHTGPPIVHRDELPALRRPSAPDEAVSVHLPAAQELMAQARKQGAPELEAFPPEWFVSFEFGRWIAVLDLKLPLTGVELDLGYERIILRANRADLLAAVKGRDELRAWPIPGGTTWTLLS